MNSKTSAPIAHAQHTEEQIRVLDAVAALANSPTSEEDDALRASLERQGQLVPCLRHNGLIVDGRRRLKALQDLGREPWVVDIDAFSGAKGKADSATALGHAYFAANVLRRQTPLIVRAAMADALASLRKGANQHTSMGAMSREEAARLVGVSADTVDRYRAVKADPDVHAKALEGQCSLQQAARLVRSKAQAAHAATLTSSDGDLVANLDRLILAGAQMGVVYADVPTDYGHSSSTALAAPHAKYPTMSTQALKDLPVDRIAATDSVLWYWTPNCMIPEALEVVRAWGFTYVTSAVWAKPTGVVSPGAIRPYHETLLVAKRGQGLIHSGERMPSVYQSPALARRHSAKPIWFADQIDRLYPDAAKIELFARSTRHGWTTLGNQVKVGKVAEAGTTQAANDPECVSDASSTPVRKTPSKKPVRAARAASVS